MYFPHPVPRKVSNALVVLALLLATLAAAVLAYGTDPYWARFRHGLGLILFTHRMQWVLATVSLLMCVAVIAMIIAGRRRAWWLISLGPILALFVHRFVANPMREFAIVENPTGLKASEATFLRDADYVVGVQFGDTAYAYPFAALYSTPVVIQATHDQRFMLIWSAFANRAVAIKIDREIKAGELSIVSMPVNTLLLYNARGGQFINGVTGETTRKERPIGFHALVETHKMMWKQWAALHPKTLVMPPRDGNVEPSRPVIPQYEVPGPSTRPVETQVVFAPTTRPIAVPVEATQDIANVSAGETQLLLVRDREAGTLRAFDRRVQEDLFPFFRRKRDPKRPAVAFEDKDSGTEWSADGKGIEGTFKGQQLRSVKVEDAVYWGVLKYWYPDVEWVVPAPGSDEAGVFRNPTDTRRRRR